MLQSWTCSEFQNPFFQLINYGTKEESDMYLILQIYSKNAEPHWNLGIKKERSDL